MADQRHRLALFFDHATKRGEQELGLRRRQHRRGLVEHEHLGVSAEALDDLDPLAHAGGEIGDPVIGIDVETVLLADLTDPLAHVLGVEATDVAEGHVLPHGERLDEAEVLVHHRDAAGGGIDGIDDLHLLPVQLDLAGVGQHEADEHLHQRRLAGAVLAEDAVDAAAVQRDADAVAGDDLPEVLGDVDEFHGGRGAELPARVDVYG